jgi:Protein of unknown function (DUF4242)
MNTPSIPRPHAWHAATRALLALVIGAASLSARGNKQVHYRGSMLMPRDEVVLCFFEATSVAAVEAAARRAGIPFARIVESTGVPGNVLSKGGAPPVGAVQTERSSS